VGATLGAYMISFAPQKSLLHIVVAVLLLSRLHSNCPTIGFEAQKCDPNSVSFRKPYLDLYQLAGSLVRAEPLSIALYDALQFGCHPLALGDMR